MKIKFIKCVVFTHFWYVALCSQVHVHAEQGALSLKLEKSLSDKVSPEQYAVSQQTSPSPSKKPVELQHGKVANTQSIQLTKQYSPSKGASHKTFKSVPITVAATDSVVHVPDVNVDADRVTQQPRYHHSKTITVVSKADIARKQPTTIFDVVRDVPGVAVVGGPRAGGMRFNIRGYDAGDDVVVKVDGAFKGFNKYRYSGTFIEPELLKSIEVQRGPQIASGSGALGGTVIATTKSAADYLKVGEKVGARAKLGYGNNNHEFSTSYMVYALPHERIDLLYNQAKRDANDIIDGSGEAIANSAVLFKSRLLKLVALPTDDITLTTSITTYDDVGLQPFDMFNATPGFFGFVNRTIDDKNYVQQIEYNPEHPWIDLNVNIARGYTNVIEVMEPGMSGLNPDFPFCDGIINTLGLPIICRGNRTDNIKNQNTSVDIQNTAALYDGDNLSLSLFAGYQYLDSVSTGKRTFDNPLYIDTTGGLVQGSKTVNAAFIQPTLTWGKLSIVPGIRYDHYAVEAINETKEVLAIKVEGSKITEQYTTASLGLVYDLIPNQLSFFSNYSQGVRPPVVNQYFTRGVQSRCSIKNMPSGPKSRACGEIYQPETSDAIELGVNYSTASFLSTGLQLASKLTLYAINTKNTIGSLGETVDGEIVQRGREKRRGVELESQLNYEGFYSRFAYSHIRGSIKRDESSTNGTFDSIAHYPLYTAPANRLNLTLGYQPIKNLDFSLNYTKVWSRTIVTSDGAVNPLEFGTQSGYEVFGYGVYYQPSKHLSLRLVGENVFDKKYNLDNGFSGALGLVAPGRNVKFYTEFIY